MAITADPEPRVSPTGRTPSGAAPLGSSLSFQGAAVGVDDRGLVAFPASRTMSPGRAARRPRRWPRDGPGCSGGPSRDASPRSGRRRSRQDGPRYLAAGSSSRRPPRGSAPRRSGHHRPLGGVAFAGRAEDGYQSHPPPRPMPKKVKHLLERSRRMGIVHDHAERLPEFDSLIRPGPPRHSPGCP